MNKIAILDGYTINPTIEELNMFKQFGEVSFFERTPPHLTVERIGTANIVITDSTYIGKNEMDLCPSVELICILATGLNSVDMEYAKERKIEVLNVPEYGAVTVSQHAFALLLNGTNRLKIYDEFVSSGQWTKGHKNNQDNVPCWSFPTFELSGKIMGIIGFGNIGKQSVKTALAFGMKVLVSTDYPDMEFLKRNKISGNLEFCLLSDVYKKSDVIMIHCPLRDNSIGSRQGQAEFINKTAIERMKDGVILINTARGKLINQKDLADALNLGKVAFAGLDVLALEPATSQNPLLTAKNCLITPHIAWTSDDARKRIFAITLENLQRYINRVVT